MKKKCRTCKKVKAHSLFYKSKNTADGCNSECKICTQNRSSIWARNNRLRCNETKRISAEKPERKAKLRAYFQTPEAKKRAYESTKNWRKRNKHKTRAHNAVGAAVRSGKLKKQNCKVCNTDKNIISHHEDYNKIFDVIWLCQSHHLKLHAGIIKLEKNT